MQTAMNNCQRSLTSSSFERSPILVALDVLNDRLVNADSVGQALELAAGENPPAWVHVFNTQLESVRQASESLEFLLRGYGGPPPCERSDADGGVPDSPPTSQETPCPSIRPGSPQGTQASARPFSVGLNAPEPSLEKPDVAA